jgi:hypothetical protein
MIGGLMGELLIFVWLIIFGGIGALLTFVSHKIFKKKIITYIPAIVGFGIVLYYVFMLLFVESEGMLELAYFASLMLFGASFLGSLLTAYLLNRK